MHCTFVLVELDIYYYGVAYAFCNLSSTVSTIACRVPGGHIYRARRPKPARVPSSPGRVCRGGTPAAEARGRAAEFYAEGDVDAEVRFRPPRLSFPTRASHCVSLLDVRVMTASAHRVYRH
jgi:hypothetical protein